ncbi:MAG: EAL domain-containing protein [Clostridia bacterium]|nr:EAL domain-containing protein [Clostridia bacterium]
MQTTKRSLILILSALMLTIILAADVFPQIRAFAAEPSDRVVRVGWYESPFNTTDEFGRRTGYAYQYQQKIAAYTGWSYEYVEGSWAELMQMLIEGKIDLMSDISYTEERAENMLFSSHPMGSENYYIYAASGNGSVSSEDLSTFNGKKIGVAEGSFQLALYRKWAEQNGVNAEIVELSGTEYDNIDKLIYGKIDLYVTLDAFGDPEHMDPICKIGSSDFYFAVSKDRPELLTELNGAMSRIQTENPYYYHQLNKQYLETSGANLYLTAEEKEWLDSHGTVKVGYQDNYLSFCAQDPETGELTGALKDYLEIASDCLKNAHIDFEAIVYPTSAAALEAVKNGDIDCMFPANLTDYDGETQGFFMTSPLMKTDMSAVVRNSEKKEFFTKDHITVAVNAGNPNYNMFLLDNFPDWRSIFFKDTQECLLAISEGKADCLIISNYRFNNISKLCEKYDLSTVSTGVEMNYCFAVKRGSTELYSILTKITGIVPDSSVNAALSYYFTEDARSGILELIVKHLAEVLIISAAVLTLIIFLLIKNVSSAKKANAHLKLISATETDDLTGLYNKNYFLEYANRIYVKDPEKPMDAVVLNIDRFHSVNAMNGRAFGDAILRVISEEIRAFLSDKKGIAGHSMADQFAIYCEKIDDYEFLYERFQGRLDMLSTNARIRVRMGVMPWQKGMDPAQQVEQALIACSLARGRFKEHIVVFNDDLRERESREQRMLNDMQRAVESREFVIYYQPKYDIRRSVPEFTSAEALVRWRHPELGLLKPGDFIPLFEKNGQIGVIDRYVTSEVVSQIARWRKKYGKIIPVSINLSRVDMFDPALERTLDQELEKKELDNSAISLEITESAYSENADQIGVIIEKLRKKGYKIEIDDFGTGYSSLSMLSSMPVDVIKMDRTFIRNIENDEKDVQLMELIFDIAKNLKLPVIAEGVETETQYRLLRKSGCEYVQGYYFSRPLPADDFEKDIIEKTSDDN